MSKERGVVLIFAILAVFLMAALAASLAVMTATELRIAGNYMSGKQARYAAEAGLEIAMQELNAAADWKAVLAGTTTSSFSDGPPVGTRNVGGGATIDLTDVTSKVKVDNSTLRLFVFGPANQLLTPAAGSDLQLQAYVMVWVGSDPAGAPDGVVMRADAFGPAASRRGVEARISKTEGGAVRMLSWKDIRE
jgi:hypothetical protein